MTGEYGDGAEVVRLTFDNADEVLAPHDDGAPFEEPPPPGDDDGGARHPAPDDGLPKDCPVAPLGVVGDLFWYLDALHQLRAVKGKDHSKLQITALFGKYTAALYRAFPKVDKSGRATGWQASPAAEALMAACAARGVWDVFGRVRGPGCWMGEDGELVYHAGNVIVSGGGAAEDAALEQRRPGRIGRYVYPAAPALPAISAAPALAGQGGPAAALLEILETWNWARGEADAHLLLGWIGAAMLGGALAWRPMAWITGDRATGKSTLHELLRAVLGDAVLSVADTSAAGIWQRLGHASLPVAVDELEAEEDNRRGQAVIKLARQAASGGVMLRGGADHQATEFQARSCFLFSSILLPPLLSQDRSRMAILELGPLDKGAGPPGLSPKLMGDIGAGLRRRLLDHWPRLAGLRETFAAQLAVAGHGGRGADQFGTLLACADVLLHDHAPDNDNLAKWAALLDAAALAERSDDAADHERCVAHLLTSAPEVYRGGARRLVADYVRDVVDGDEAGTALQALSVVGLKVFNKGPPQAPLWMLAVANSHVGLAKLFEGTHWASRSGASGVWVQALRRCDGAGPSGALRFGGVASRATVIPVAGLLAGQEGQS